MSARMTFLRGGGVQEGRKERGRGVFFFHERIAETVKVRRSKRRKRVRRKEKARRHIDAIRHPACATGLRNKAAGHPAVPPMQAFNASIGPTHVASWRVAPSGGIRQAGSMGDVQQNIPAITKDSCRSGSCLLELLPPPPPMGGTCSRVSQELPPSASEPPLSRHQSYVQRLFAS